MLSMLDAGHDLPLCRAVAGELVGDHHSGRPHLPLQQLAQQPLGCLLVAAALDQDVEHDAGLVHGSPKPMLYPGNSEHGKAALSSASNTAQSYSTLGACSDALNAPSGAASPYRAKPVLSGPRSVICDSM